MYSKTSASTSRGINPKLLASPKDITELCKFFKIGKLQSYEQEKDILRCHFNVSIFVVTTQGEFRFKFYPSHRTKNILFEYKINHILRAHRFLTPSMYAGSNHRSFFTHKNHLVTCYSYIEGSVLDKKHIQRPKIVEQINAGLLSLKNILAAKLRSIPCERQENFVTTVHMLIQKHRAMSASNKKKVIETSLLEICRTYQHHQTLFTQQWIHNDAILNNFLISKKTIYTLDLEHIQKTYILTDLAKLVISCLSFDASTSTIKNIVKNYFAQHQLKPQYLIVLETLIKMYLIWEYLGAYQNADIHQQRKKSITQLIEKINEIPELIR